MTCRLSKARSTTITKKLQLFKLKARQTFTFWLQSPRFVPLRLLPSAES